MRVSRRSSRITAIRLLAGIAIAGAAYSLYLMACNSNQGPSMTVAIVVPTTPSYGIYGQPYNQQLTVSNSTDSYTWSVDPSAGPLPTGVQLDPTTGALSMSPTAVGTFTPTIDAVDNKTGTKLTAMLCIDVFFAVTPAELAQGTGGVAYTQTLGGMGGQSPYTGWQVFGGSLPSWLTLTSAGVLSGTPPTTGTFPMTVIFTVQGTDMNSVRGRKTDTLTILAAPVVLTITTASPLPGGTVGLPYATPGAQINAAGGTPPYTWAWAATSGPPPGLALGPNSGLLSGTPTAASNAASYTVQVTDGATPPNTAKKTFALTVAIGITPTILPTPTEGVAYSQQLTANGASGATTWGTTGNVPTGLKLDATTGTGTTAGLLHGTPTASGSFPFAVQVSDAATPANTGLQEYNVNVTPAQVTITNASALPAGTVGAAYNNPLLATGGTGTYVFSVTSGAVPTGLTLNADGTWSNTPTTAGPFSFTAMATSGTATPASKAFTVTINAAPLTITSQSPLPAGTINTVYDPPSGYQFTASGGTGADTWLITSAPSTVPAGVTLSTGGVLSGTPTASGTFTLTVKVTDAASHTASGNFAVNIAPASGTLVITTTSPLPQAFVSNQYYLEFTASGGTPPYLWSPSSGGIVYPPGMGLIGGGLFSGIPTATGATTIPITVTDHVGAKASGSFMITVNPAPSTCFILVNGTNQPAPGGVQTLPSVQSGFIDGYNAPMSAPGCLSSDPISYSGWMVTSGSMPAGFGISPPSGAVTALYNPGVITGPGTYTFSITFTGFDPNDNSGHNVTQAYSLTITP